MPGSELHFSVCTGMKYPLNIIPKKKRKKVYNMPTPTPSPQFVQYIVALLNELIEPTKEDKKTIETKTSFCLFENH